MDWSQSRIIEELALQNVITAANKTALENVLADDATETATIWLELAHLDAYLNSWGEKAAEWLILAVVRMIQDVLTAFQDAQFGVVVPHQFAIVCPEDHQQEIAHLCLTAYQEIYNVLLRTHRKPSSPIWHRRAVTQFFPQLILTVDAEGDILPLEDDHFEA